MVNRPAVSIENNFIGGFKTEYTALNFPENACTDADNTVFSIIGEVNRRGGFNQELNGQINLNSPTGAVSTYKWNNVGGDGSTQIVVQQSAGFLKFYLSSEATISDPLSTQLLTSTINIGSFLAINATSSFDIDEECTYTDGNGYLFVFNNQCDPFYVTFDPSTQLLTGIRINIQTRDFKGLDDDLALGTRPTTLSNEHYYNLINQGWNLAWTGNLAIGQVQTYANGTYTWSLNTTNLPLAVNESVQVIVANAAAFSPVPYMIGTISSFTPTSITVVITSQSSGSPGALAPFLAWNITPNPNNITDWYNTLHNYPANCDVWWYYRDTNVNAAAPDGKFNPNLAAQGWILPTNSQAPQGAVILNAFIQDRSKSSGIAGITTVSTVKRPTHGAFYAGRVWYSGVDANFLPQGDADFYTWTETIYFSNIITTPSDFGNCYEQNDPTSSVLFDLLPSDGGTVVIQGCGPIYKLFPVQNGLVVFAANGIWYITGGQAVGFTADNYSVNKISGVQSIGYHSYVNVLGWPVFWTADGIYELRPDGGNTPYGQGGFVVNNLCLGTILTFYNDIPLEAKMYARGDYDPISFVIQWLYKSTNSTSIQDLYTFDRMLNLNTYKAPFYKYSVSIQSPYISSMLYVTSPGGSGAPDPAFKYLTFVLTGCTFSEENDFTNWIDWTFNNPVDYSSTFTTGYKLHGQMQRQFGIEYIYVFSKNAESTAYQIQSLWDFSTSGNSGKWSSAQMISNVPNNFGNTYRRLRLRGHGLAVQIKFNSISGQPFSFIGWSIAENQSSAP